MKIKNLKSKAEAESVRLALINRLRASDYHAEITIPSESCAVSVWNVKHRELGKHLTEAQWGIFIAVLNHELDELGILHCTMASNRGHHRSKK